MRKFTNFSAEMLKKKNTKTCLANEVKENQEGFPKLSLEGREGEFCEFVRVSTERRGIRAW
jgi:hypothetical protein